MSCNCRVRTSILLFEQPQSGQSLNERSWTTNSKWLLCWFSLARIPAWVQHYLLYTVDSTFMVVSHMYLNMSIVFFFLTPKRYRLNDILMFYLIYLPYSYILLFGHHIWLSWCTNIPNGSCSATNQTNEPTEWTSLTVMLEFKTHLSSGLREGTLVLLSTLFT